MAVPELVSLAEVKAHVRAEDYSHDDTYLEACRVRGIAAVLNYIKQFERTEYDTLPTIDPVTGLSSVTVSTWTWPILVGGSPPYWWPAKKAIYRELPPYIVPDWFGSPGPNVPYDIQAATLLVIGNLYEDRLGERDPFSPGVVSLLERWRDPTMA